MENRRYVQTQKHVTTQMQCDSRLQWHLKKAGLVVVMKKNLRIIQFRDEVQWRKSERISNWLATTRHEIALAKIRWDDNNRVSNTLKAKFLRCPLLKKTFASNFVITWYSINNRESLLELVQLSTIFNS